MRYKVLAYTFIIAVFAATVSLLYYQQTTGDDIYAGTIHRNSYSLFDSEKTFKIIYPKSYQLVPGESKEEIGTIVMPKEIFPDTNFIDGKITVSKFENSTLADCGIYNGKKIKEFVHFNSTDFYTTEFKGAAAGNLYESKIYRTIRGSTCYEIILTLHTGNIGNYPAGSVTEVNSADAWERLDSILKTFVFTNY